VTTDSVKRREKRAEPEKQAQLSHIVRVRSGFAIFCAFTALIASLVSPS